MLSQVTVTTESPNVLKPLLRLAIQNEAKALSHGIKRTRERLAAFEKQYGMTSDEFERRYVAAEIAESLENIEWLAALAALGQARVGDDGRYVTA